MTNKGTIKYSNCIGEVTVGIDLARELKLVARHKNASYYPEPINSLGLEYEW